MSPLIYIGLLIMLVTIVSEVVFVVNYLYLRFIKRRPAKVQKKIFITFAMMMCGFIVFLLGTQKVFSSKEVSSFEITAPTMDESVADINQDVPVVDDNTLEAKTIDTVWYDQIFSEENKETVSQVLNETGQFVDNMINVIGEGISHMMNE